MTSRLIDLLQTVNDERSFLDYLRALREDCEANPHDCPARPEVQCIEDEHFESQSTRDFLKSAENWARGGDFEAGMHHGEPILRRVATLLYAGKYRPRE